MVEHSEAMELQRRGLEDFFRVLAAAAPSSGLLEFPGVIACCAPGAATRSFPNSVVYESAEELSAALDALAAEYRHAGVEAWTVWVPEEDRAAARILERAGHRLDASPAAMVLELADLPEPDLDGLDWDAEASAEEVARLNDIAYGVGPGFDAIFTRNPTERLRMYRARIDGELASVAGMLDRDDGDSLLLFVATDPAARNTGLARRLCHAALAEARERGLATSSLQATKLGRPVYERLGYRSYGAIEMWERR